MTEILNLFEEKRILKVCAPMVRYSKLEFRTLVRKYGCDLCYTPMIMADSFITSEKARQNEFKTNKDDKPLIVQFAANNMDDFVGAAELVSPYCGGVDLNCGCPQRWAMKEGYGAELLKKPQLIKDMVRQVRNRIPHPFTISVKIRLKEDIRKTIELCQNIQAAGASFLTVHGRTAKQRGEPVNVDSIRDIVQSLTIPVIANGDIKSMEDVHEMGKETGCKGVMCARGILQNPALFSGEISTPLSCVENWLDICARSKPNYQCFHHHLVFMSEKLLSKPKRRIFNTLTSVADVLEFLKENLNITPPELAIIDNFHSEIMYKDVNLDDGSYFKSKMTEDNNTEAYIGDSCIQFS